MNLANADFPYLQKGYVPEYVKTVDEANRKAQELLIAEECEIGLDCEWATARPYGTATTLPSWVDVLVLSTQKRTIIFHLSTICGRGFGINLPRNLRDLLESKQKIFVSCSIIGTSLG